MTDNPLDMSIEENRNKFVSDMEEVMSSESKEILKKLLTSFSGDTNLINYIFALGFLRGSVDIQDLPSIAGWD